MARNFILYIISFLLLISILYLFNVAYERLSTYSTLTSRHNDVYNIFHILSKQINSTALLTQTSENSTIVADKKGTNPGDTASIIQQAGLLQATVRDSISINIAARLNVLIRSEISWISKSNVVDSINAHLATKHVSAFQTIDSLINAGIDRTLFLIDSRENELAAAIRKVKTWMFLFITITGLLLIYTTINLLLQRKIRQGKERELATSEMRFRSVIDNSAEGITLTDERSNNIYRSPSAIRMVGALPSDTLTRAHPDDIEMIKAKVNQCLSLPATPIPFEGRFKHQSGKYVWLEGTLNNLLHAKEVKAIVANFRDVTQKKEADEKINELNKSLEQKVIKRTEELKKTNEELEAFSYSVSHDLRAPLRAITGFSSILEEEYANKLDDEGRRLISVIKENTGKMEELIADLLAFSKLGRQYVVKAKVNMEEMIKEVIETLVDQTGRSNIEWVIHSLPPVDSEQATLRQVWTNLLSNAIKYSRNNEKPRIEIGASKRNSEIAFYIKDNGVGFDNEHANKLFRVFQRLHTVEEFEGTGVGLAIVEKVISKHGGRVWAEGEIDRGATFWFSLPDEE